MAKFNWGRALTSAGNSLQDYFMMQDAGRRRQEDIARRQQETQAQRDWASQQRADLWARQDAQAEAARREKYALDPMNAVPQDVADYYGMQPTQLPAVFGASPFGVNAAGPSTGPMRQESHLANLMAKMPKPDVPAPTEAGMVMMDLGDDWVVPVTTLSDGTKEYGTPKQGRADGAGGGVQVSGADLTLLHGDTTPQVSYNSKTDTLTEYDKRTQGALVYPETPAGTRAQAEAKILTEQFLRDDPTLTPALAAEMAYQAVDYKYGLEYQFDFPVIDQVAESLGYFPMGDGTGRYQNTNRWGNWFKDERTALEFSKMVVEKIDQIDGKSDGILGINPKSIIPWMRDKGLSDPEIASALEGFDADEARAMLDIPSNNVAPPQQYIDDVSGWDGYTENDIVQAENGKWGLRQEDGSIGHPKGWN
jgi:hypothetical protein